MYLQRIQLLGAHGAERAPVKNNAMPLKLYVFFNQRVGEAYTTPKRTNTLSHNGRPSFKFV